MQRTDAVRLKGIPPAGSRAASAGLFSAVAFWLILALTAGPAEASEASEKPPEEAAGSSEAPVLEPVTVTATRIPSEAVRVPAAVTTVRQEDIGQGREGVRLDDTLAGVPGVFVQNEFNFAQDLRISIRGFGARSAFGIRGIQVYVDGLPLTLPDGQTNLDTLDPEVISRTEVLRGPISPLYGNASGGVINIVTEQGPDKPFLEGRALAGAQGLWKLLLKGGGQKGPVNSFAALSHLESGGYRDHSRAQSTLFNSKLRVDLDDASDVSLILNAVRTPEAQDPGGLTAAQAAADPTQAAPLSLLYDTGESVADQRLGLVYRRELSGRQHLEGALWLNRRDLENAIPFRFVELERHAAGGRLQYDVSGAVFGRPHRIVAGLDLQHQIDDRANYDNVAGAAGGARLLDQKEKVTAWGLYLQQELEPAPGWSLLLGGRYDDVRFAIDDRLPQDGDDSGSRTFAQFTGRLGLSYALRPELRLYALVAQSFETPTTTEVVNRPEGGGGINPEVEPQTAVNYEVGAKLELGADFRAEAALFVIRLKDELIAFRDATDRVFYRNAGESRRIGAELGLTRKLVRDVRMRLAYTYLKAEFDTYFKSGADLGGNRTPGLPPHRLWAELRYTHSSGLYASGGVRYAAAFFVDDENTLENDPATMVDARLGFEKKHAAWIIEPFAGINNVLNTSTNGNVRINAAGGRYFEPAPGIRFYGGVRVRYHWL